MNITELFRLINNLIRTGTIAEIDAATARVRVQSGDNLTDWLPWLHQRAGTTRDWNPPTLGEQVVLLCPGGDLAQGLILSGINSNENPAPKNDLALWYKEFPDGTRITYNHSDKKMLMEFVGELTINVQGNAAVTAQGEVTVDAPAIRSNGGAGVVTGAHKCLYTGTPHSDCSSSVFAGQ